MIQARWTGVCCHPAATGWDDKQMKRLSYLAVPISISFFPKPVEGHLKFPCGHFHTGTSNHVKSTKAAGMTTVTDLFYSLKGLLPFLAARGLSDLPKRPSTFLSMTSEGGKFCLNRHHSWNPNIGWNEEHRCRPDGTRIWKYIEGGLRKACTCLHIIGTRCLSGPSL